MKLLKNMLCLLIIIGFPAISQAQFVKGDNIVTGTFNFNTNSSSETSGSSIINGPKTTNINMKVGGMRIINDQVGPGALGLGLQVSLLNTILKEEEGTTTTTQSTPTFEIAPYARSYFTNTSQFALFAEGLLGFSFGTNKMEVSGSSGTSSTQINTSGFRFNVSPGVNYSLTQNIGLELLLGSLGYKSSTTKYTSSSKETVSDFGLRFDLSTVQVGLSYKL